MKTLLAILLASTSLHAAQVVEGDNVIQALRSTYKPFEDIGNAHSVHSDNRVLRGAQPVGKGKLLKKDGVTDILIFKNQKKDEVDKEVSELLSLGYKKSQIHHVPMAWKGITEFKGPCEQTLTALQVIRDTLNNPKGKVYFHCTVGEDRTGMLAGLYRMVFENWDVEKAFGGEMCQHGFAEANARKPKHVSDDVNSSITPLFAKMAYLVKKKQISKEKLDFAVCARDPFEGEPEAEIAKYGLTKLDCPDGIVNAK